MFMHPGKAQHSLRLLDRPTGDCFRQAFWWCESYAAVTKGRVMLVHGFPVLTAPGDHFGKPYAHAWVEIETIHKAPDGTRVKLVEVVDPSRGGIGNPTWVPRAMFYLVGRIEAHTPPRRYNAARAVAMLAKHQHYGGWEPYPAGVLCRDMDTGVVIEAE